MYGRVSMFCSVKVRMNGGDGQAEETSHVCRGLVVLLDYEDRSSDLRRLYLAITVIWHCCLARGTAYNLLSPALQGKKKHGLVSD